MWVLETKHHCLLLDRCQTTGYHIQISLVYNFFNMQMHVWWNGQSGTQYTTIVPLYIAICRAYLLFHPASLHNCLQHIILVPFLSAQYYRLPTGDRAQYSISRLPAKRMLWHGTSDSERTWPYQYTCTQYTVATALECKNASCHTLPPKTFVSLRRKTRPGCTGPIWIWQKPDRTTRIKVI